MTAAQGGNQSNWQYYTYNADGQRVRRKVEGLETWQAYGMDGELLAEYAMNALATNPQKEYGYRNGQLLVTAEAPFTINVAAAANGATASASSAYSGYAASATNNGDRKGLGIGSNGVWSTASSGFPAWLQIDFNGSKTISEIDIFTEQDNYSSPSEPTETMTFSSYGLTGYDVQYWDGSSWVTITNGSVTGNNKVWRKFTFSSITTTKIRVLSNASPDGYSRLTEVEAWGAASGATMNVALASNSAVASASSAYSGYAASAANNGDRKGLGIGSNGVWSTASSGFPAWLQIDFNGSKTINEIDVFTEQDNYTSPSEPTETMTFSSYGLTGYDVQYWNGSSWVTITGGSITGNNNVWRKFTFTPVTTTKIRVLSNASPDGYSRLTEVEAWGIPSGASGASTINWLVTDQLGTARMIVDQSGTLANVKRHDYLPFGEELYAGTGGRTTGLGYSADTIRQKFTLKERDNETGLDYFNARYYASTQGRFTSADPLLSSGGIYDPQTWNRFSYTLNNPLKFIDPTGMFVWDTSLGGSADDKDVSGKIRDKRKQIRAAIAKANEALNSGKLDSTQKASLERALNAYGAEGAANGVSLAVGKGSDGAAAETASTQPYVLYDQKTGNFSANVTVTFKEGGSVDAESFAHEGSHVADRQELVAAFAKASTGDPSADWLYMPENLKVRQTESSAYRVSAAVAQGLGNSFNPGGYEVWNTGWRAADRSANMQKGIKEILTKSSLYKDKLNHRLIRTK